MVTSIDNPEHKTPLLTIEQQAAEKALKKPGVPAKIAKATSAEIAKATKETKDKIGLTQEGEFFLKRFSSSQENISKIKNDARRFEKMSFVLNGNSVLLKDFLLEARFDQKGGLLYGDSDIPAGHDLLKLAQLYLRSQNLSILDGNKKTELQSIDGHFRNDSMHALMTYQNIIREKEMELTTRIKERFQDFSESIIRKGKVNGELQSERGVFKIENHGHNVKLRSYSGITYYDLSTGTISNTVKGQNGETTKFEFTGGFLLSPNIETGELLGSNVNNENLEAIMGFMNLLNRANYLSDKIRNKAADNYRPFHLDSTYLDLMPLSATSKIPGMASIEIENGLKDEHLIKISNLEKYLKPFEGKVNPRSVILYLNKMHETKYRPLLTSKKEITIGGKSY